MEIRVTLLENFKFAIHARSHSIVCDQPTDNGGEDAGMTPPELMLASLGSCAEFYAAQYLKARNLQTRDLEVRVTAEKLAHPARLGDFRVHVTSPVALTEEQTEGLRRSVHHCLIHNTLLAPPQIQIEIKLGQPVLS